MASFQPEKLGFPLLFNGLLLLESMLVALALGAHPAAIKTAWILAALQARAA